MVNNKYKKQNSKQNNIKYLLYSLVILIPVLFSCKSTKDAIIYKKHKTYKYDAFFIQNFDTITKEKIYVQPKGHSWFWDRSQIACKYYYFMDSVGYKKIINPMNRYQKSNETMKQIKKDKNQEFYGLWKKKETTGVEETPNLIWIHPFRNNQYIYTEVAPYPEIDFNFINNLDSSWSSTITLFPSWDNFEGTCTSTYTVKGKTDYVYKNLKLTDCLVINSVAHHSVLGDSYLNYIFHPKHGFVEMKYKFYDGTKIDFYMYEFTDKKSKK